MIRFIKDFAKAFAIGIFIFIVLGIIQYLNGYRYQNAGDFLTDLAYNQVYALVFYMSIAYFFKIMLKRYKSSFLKLETIAILSLGVICITIVDMFFLRMISEILIDKETYAEFIDTEQPQFYYVAVFIALVISTIFYIINFYKHKQVTEVKEQKIIAGAASAKFDALKNQLDPHFLFNSLNVLTSLIDENPDAATKFTTSLSKVYRYVLEQKNKELVTIEEELNFAKTYMSLIKMRFEDSIIFSIPEKLSNPEAKVVPLSLQLLLENAVKHNMVTPSKKLYITIEEQNGVLHIKNNIQLKQVVRGGSGVGLKNIKQRYYLLSDRPVTITHNEHEFIVSIPLLTKRTTIMEPQKEYILDKKYERAKERVENLKGFYIHFTIYLIMIPVFIYLNIRSTSFPWAIFPIVGWGFGVAGHAMEAFDYNPFLGKNWEERKIRELMDKDDFDKKL